MRASDCHKSTDPKIPQTSNSLRALVGSTYHNTYPPFALVSTIRSMVRRHEPEQFGWLPCSCEVLDEMMNELALHTRPNLKATKKLLLEKHSRLLTGSITNFSTQPILLFMSAVKQCTSSTTGTYSTAGKIPTAPGKQKSLYDAS